MKQPKVIFLDAVGTLFGVRGSVGEVYAQLASQFGVEVPADVVNTAFFESFAESPPAAFPGIEAGEIPRYEFEWWYAIATQTFKRAGVIEHFIDFSSFFVELYTHFSTADPWFVYPEVHATLTRWQQQGISLGVVSNFDSRLYPVLQALDLAKFFASVTTSTEVGAAKPDAKIFALALEKHDCPVPEALHIGDSYWEDYQGAKAAGLQSVWLKRP